MTCSIKAGCSNEPEIKLCYAGYSGQVTAVSEPCFSDPGMTNSNMQVLPCARKLDFCDIST